MAKLNIAIIGGGIAGLTAGYYLNKRHNITLFEKSDRIGGNAYTHITPEGDAPDIAVAVFGKAGYKNFYKLLDELGVSTVPGINKYMSFHDLDTRDGLYLTPSLRKSMHQNFRQLKPRHLWSAVRFFLGLGRAAIMMKAGGLKDATVAECLDALPEMKGEPRMLLLCAFSLLSSMEPAEILAAPGFFFLNKLAVHRDLISPEALYSVRAVRGGTRLYVGALSVGYASRIVYNARLRTVRRGVEGATLVFDNGETQTFHKVVFACNPDQALKLLETPSKREKELLGSWRYKDGRVVVHRDLSYFPPREFCEAYTFLYTQRGGRFETSVNGALWHQPYVSADCPYISTQHPNFPIFKELTDLDVTLRTPIFDKKSCATTALLPTLNNMNNSFYCGSYFGFGLHEDAVTSAMAVAKYFKP